MTVFQMAALITPALILMALIVMVGFVRRQNKAAQFASASAGSSAAKVLPAGRENLEHAAAAADERTVAQLARLNERLATNSLPDAAIENLVRSSEIDRKLDLITDLLKSRARAT